MIRVMLAAIGSALLVAPGCQKTMTATVSQPNPMANPTETLYQSEPVVIITGDMELQAPRPAKPGEKTKLQVNDRFPLHNVAKFTIISRDRLRFHVQLEHKWKDYADVSTWRAELVDDKGRHYVPVSVESPREGHVVLMWDFETRSVVRNHYGDIVRVVPDGYKRRRTLGSLSVFRGRGDFVFYGRDLFSSDVKSLTLSLARRGFTFQFTWRFTDEDTQGTAIADRVPAAMTPIPAAY